MNGSQIGNFKGTGLIMGGAMEVREEGGLGGTREGGWGKTRQPL